MNVSVYETIKIHTAKRIPINTKNDTSVNLTLISSNGQLSLSMPRGSSNFDTY